MNILSFIWAFIKAHLPHMLMSVPVKGAVSGDFNNKALSDLASGKYGVDGSNMADYYVSFSHYFNITKPIAYWITGFFGWVGNILYNLGQALIQIYVKLFDIFSLSANNEHLNGIRNSLEILGTVGCMIAVTVTIVIVVINPNQASSKAKAIAWNAAIITFFLGAFPFAMTNLPKGIQYAADHYFNTQSTETAKIPDYIVQTNVLDLSNVTVDSVLNHGGQMPDEVNDNNIFVRTTDYSQNVKIKPFIINESQMTQEQLNKWSGFNGTDAGTFLSQAGDNQNNLTNDTLSTWRDTLNTGKVNKDGKDLANNWYKQNIFKSLGQIGDAAKNKLGIDDDGSKILSVFTYHTYGVGDSAVIQQLPEFSETFGSKLFKLGSDPVGGVLSPAFYETYTRYSINWFNIFLGLIFLCCAMGAYLFKIVKTWFKAVVIMATSFPIMAKNISRTDKLKQFMGDAFGIFEIMAFDVVVVYLMLYCYTMLNSFLNTVIYSFGSASLANPVVSAIIIFICDIALFQAGLGRIKAIDNQVGGEANAQGHEQSMLQTLTTLKMGTTAIKAIGADAKSNGKRSLDAGLATYQGGKKAADAYKAFKAKRNAKNGGLGNVTSNEEDKLQGLPNTKKEDKSKNNNENSDSENNQNSENSKTNDENKGQEFEGQDNLPKDDPKDIKSDQNGTKEVNENSKSSDSKKSGGDNSNNESKTGNNLKDSSATQYSNKNGSGDESPGTSETEEHSSEETTPGTSETEEHSSEETTPGTSETEEHSSEETTPGTSETEEHSSEETTPGTSETEEHSSEETTPGTSETEEHSSEETTPGTSETEEYSSEETTPGTSETEEHSSDESIQNYNGTHDIPGKDDKLATSKSDSNGNQNMSNNNKSHTKSDNKDDLSDVDKSLDIPVNNDRKNSKRNSQKINFNKKHSQKDNNNENKK
ncbi:hypothetical protein [Apilactobacillus timberlakei]|uniref:hypothetical protein n=1 Tax=Apilactobacillus timberlakei TaxID=2008380 RepID=UPI00112A6653|nr:hypothetical protein [Apilactobacillus timberlakei]TPR21579.1 hypothetical protein DY083_06035 [Apilactobacillus timberlakei]